MNNKLHFKSRYNFNKDIILHENINKIAIYEGEILILTMDNELLTLITNYGLLSELCGSISYTNFHYHHFILTQ